MTPHPFLEIAEDLLKLGKEAARRTSRSRSYYAAFHTARDAIESQGIRVDTGPRAHEQMVRLLQGGSANAKRAATLLQGLRVDRNNADYDMRDSRFADDQLAKSMRNRALNCIQLIDENSRDAAKQKSFRAALRSAAASLGLQVD